MNPAHWLRTGRIGAARGHLGMARDWIRHPEDRERIGFEILRRVGRRASPRYVFSAWPKAWLDDAAFFQDLRSFEQHDLLADSRFALRSLLALVDDVPGDTAECGVLHGCGSWFICEHFRGSGRVHHAIDSFAGLSSPQPADGAYWSAGDLVDSETAVRALLEPYGAAVHRGWIPDVFAALPVDATYAMVHIDLDLHDPTAAALGYFYDRLEPGGLLIFDDYGSAICPGATLAIDDLMRGRPEPVIHLPTGQGFLIKR